MGSVGPVAFVLSGGANLGAAQAGMLEALLGAGIVPDLLVGTSIGAVNAAFMAAGPSPDRARALSDVWRRLSVEEFFPLHAAQVTRAILAGGLFSTAPLRRMLEREIPFRLIEEAATPLRIVATRCERRADGPHSLRSMAAGLDRRAGQVAVPLRLAVERLDRTVETAGIPLRIVATAFERRAEEVFAAGPVLDALLASSALPLVFPPYRIDGNVYVDGALSEYVPLLPALEAGARTIYVLSLRSAAARGKGATVDDDRRRDGVYRSLGNRFWRRESLTAAQAQAAHPTVRVVELPGLSVHPGLRDFSHLGDLIEQARHEAEAFLARGTIGPAA